MCSYQQCCNYRTNEQNFFEMHILKLMCLVKEISLESWVTDARTLLDDFLAGDVNVK